MAATPGSKKRKLDHLAESNQSLLDTGKFSDVTIRRNKREFKVHKAILCPKSEHFSKACDGQFKESKQGTLSLNKEDPHVVEAMIKYLYTGDYSFDPEWTPKGWSYESKATLTFHAYVFVLAEMLMLEKLQDETAAKFEEQTEIEGWTSGDFAQAIVVVYTMAQDQESAIRRVIIKKARDLAKYLFSVGVFVRVARETPGFAADLAKALAMKHSE